MTHLAGADGAGAAAAAACHAGPRERRGPAGVSKELDLNSKSDAFASTELDLNFKCNVLESTDSTDSTLNAELNWIY